MVNDKSVLILTSDIDFDSGGACFGIKSQETFKAEQTLEELTTNEAGRLDTA
jgi:hypothetical protein